MNELLDTSLYTWDHEASFHGIAGLLIILAGLLTIFREWGNRIGWLYLFYTISLSGWVLSHALGLISLNSHTALIYFRLGNFCIALLPAVFLHISRILLNLQHIKKTHIVVVWLISVGFSLLAMFSEHFVGGLYEYSWGYYGSYSSLGTIFIFYFFGVILFTIYQYISASRNAKPGSNLQNRSRLLFLAFLIGMAGSIDFLPAYGINVYPHGYIFILGMFIISTYVTIRYRLIDITVEYAADNIISLIKSPLLVIDMDDEIRLTNEAADKLFKQTDREKVVHELLKIHKDHSQQNSDMDVEFSVATDSGTRQFDLEVSPLLSKNKMQIANIFLLNDISVQKHIEELLTQERGNLEKTVSERTRQLEHEIENHKQTEQALLLAKNVAESSSKSKSIFLSRISHELRTPLNALLGFTQILKMDYEETHSKEHMLYINQMLTAGEQLHSLIENILDLSKAETSNLQFNLEPVELYPLIDECLELTQKAREERNLDLEVHIDKCKNHKLFSDKTRLKQIVLNILLNAIKYNRDAGKIIIECEIDDKCILKISDTGIGISEQHQEKIFEPFERLSDWRHHTAGAGIGLSLSRQFAREMKGDLVLSSEEGVGSCFYLVLPLYINNYTNLQT